METFTLEDLGYSADLEKFRKDQNLGSFGVGRIASEHKDRYTIKTNTGEFDSELLGNLRFAAESRYDLPAVGDWVAFSEYDQGKALIHALYPRTSILERRAVNKSEQVQIIATNIDYALIVQAVDRDFNLNRLERYLTICNASKVTPVIVLSKIDLVSKAELDSIVDRIGSRVKDISPIPVSNQAMGYDQIKTIIKKGKTYCLLGSSGVGKSTILNGLSGKSEMKTGEISSHVNKGKHTTSHRELVVLSNGAILIDNPGMREVGIADTMEGLETTFDTILRYAQNCQFKDCSHVNEKGCAILEAVENGEIDKGSYANFRKMEKEKMHFESDAQDRKKKDKNLGKVIKSFQKQRRNYKY
ncbi:MAG: ribosome small subunit-dependent GTPase A [Cyclobacteriaceae bacterium]